MNLGARPLCLNLCALTQNPNLNLASTLRAGFVHLGVSPKALEATLRTMPWALQGLGLFEIGIKHTRLMTTMVLNLTRLYSNKKIENKSQDDIVSSQAVPSTGGDYGIGSHIHIMHMHATKRVRHPT